MEQPQELDFWSVAGDFFRALRGNGVFGSVAGQAGERNVLTLGWGLAGNAYQGHPFLAVAVAPQRHSFRFLQEAPEFVIGVPGEDLAAALALCGTKSGRDLDKFSAAGLTPVPSVQVRPPSIRECLFNIECRIYTRLGPPCPILPPKFLQRPPDKQHTVFFAEVLGTYRRG